MKYNLSLPRRPINALRVEGCVSGAGQLNILVVLYCKFISGRHKSKRKASCKGWDDLLVLLLLELL